MKKHNELNLKFHGNMELAKYRFSQALANFDKELTCSINVNICPLGQYADCNVCEYATALTCFHCQGQEQCMAENKYHQYDGE